MSLVNLAKQLRMVADGGMRWRLVRGFLSFRHEPAQRQETLLARQPPPFDGRWDAFLAALAEHLALMAAFAARPGLRRNVGFCQRPGF